MGFLEHVESYGYGQSYLEGRFISQGTAALLLIGFLATCNAR